MVNTFYALSREREREIDLVDLEAEELTTHVQSHSKMQL
jgi:hypothetical protein